MYTDLFLALLNRNNARGHPILSALVYAFCPTATHWWLAGVDPILPFDPVWQSLQDWTSGGTLREHLTRYGFEGLIQDIKEYVENVRTYRSHHPTIQAPEISRMFMGAKIASTNRFGSQNAIQHLGGDWRNLFVYVRTWAYLVDDWREGMRIERDSGYTLTSEKVSLILPFTRLPVQFDTWIWKVPVGHVMENRIGLLVSRKQQDQLRFSLLRKSSPPGKQPWPNTPTIFALDRESGESQHFDQTLPDKDLEHAVQSLSALAKNGPHPPLNAICNPLICKNCGFRNQCFNGNTISQFALKNL
jgi:hypothetical protein